MEQEDQSQLVWKGEEACWQDSKEEPNQKVGQVESAASARTNLCEGQESVQQKDPSMEELVQLLVPPATFFKNGILIDLGW